MTPGQGGYRPPTAEPRTPTGWQPPFGAQDPASPPPAMPPMPAGPPPARPPHFPRGFLSSAGAAVVVIAVAITLVFTLGGNHTVPGHATPSSDSRTVATTFLNLETARYNSGTESSTPAPSAAAYSQVSCARDLAEMRSDGASPAPLHPAHKIFAFALVSITPAKNGMQLMRISRTTLSSGDSGDGLFTLQRQGGRWTVCGLFPDTEPPDPNAQDNSGGQGSGGPGSGDQSGPSTAPAQPAGDLQGFLDTFAQAVAAGQVGTAAEAICTDDPQADVPIETWTTAHAQISAHVATTGTAGGSASLQVTVPGQPPATYTAVIAQNNGAFCIEVLTQ